jgi:hypothetical protein
MTSICLFSELGRADSEQQSYKQGSRTKTSPPFSEKSWTVVLALILTGPCFLMIYYRVSSSCMFSWRSDVSHAKCWLHLNVLVWTEQLLDEPI